MTRVEYYTKYLFKYMLVIIIFYGFLKFMNYVDIYKILIGISDSKMFLIYTRKFEFNFNLVPTT